MHLDTSGIFDAFERTLALVGDEERERLQRILRASEDSVQRAVADVLREVAREVNEATGGHVHAEVVLGAEGPEFKVTADPSAEAGPSIEFDFDPGEVERLTLRLPAELKELAALAAEQHGVSLNAWLTRLVSREAARREEPRRGGPPGSRGGPGGRGEPEGPGGRGGRGGQTLKGWIGG